VSKEQEDIERLRRAFKDDPDVFIVMDGQTMRSPNLTRSWNLAIDLGWLRVEDYETEQYTAMHGYLTDKGRAALFMTTQEQSKPDNDSSES